MNTMVRWISKEMPAQKVQYFLNQYDFVAESMTIISMGGFSGESWVLVVFLLRQSYNSQKELDDFIAGKSL